MQWFMKGKRAMQVWGPLAELAYFEEYVRTCGAAVGFLCCTTNRLHHTLREWGQQEARDRASSGVR
eukprot:6759488-Prymnesium_polylepis.1